MEPLSMEHFNNACPEGTQRHTERNTCCCDDDPECCWDRCPMTEFRSIKDTVHKCIESEIGGLALDPKWFLDANDGAVAMIGIFITRCKLAANTVKKFLLKFTKINLVYEMQP